MGEPRERRYIAEYVMETFPDSPVKLGCPLGPGVRGLVEEYGLPKALTMSRGFRPEVDGLVILEDKIILIEAKIFKIVDGISKLPVYAGLIPSTPELWIHRKLPVEMRLVTPWLTAQVQEMAKGMGVVVAIYNPPWIKDYVDKMHGYWLKDAREARAAKLQLRKMLGVE